MSPQVRAYEHVGGASGPQMRYRAPRFHVRDLFDGPFPWQTMFGFQLAGMIGHDFFKAYAVTFDFEGMTIYMK